MPEAREKEEGEREETGTPGKGKKQEKECSRCSERICDSDGEPTGRR